MSLQQRVDFVVKLALHILSVYFAFRWGVERGRRLMLRDIMRARDGYHGKHYFGEELSRWLRGQEGGR